MSFREYTREYHAVAHIVLVICLIVVIIHIFYEKDPSRVNELFLQNFSGIIRAIFALIINFSILFQISKPLFMKGLLPRYLSDLFYRPPRPSNFKPKAFSEEWLELQCWLAYKNRWKDRWYNIKEPLLAILLFIAVIGGAVLANLLLFFIFGVDEDKATSLLIIIIVIAAISYSIGKRRYKKS